MNGGKTVSNLRAATLGLAAFTLVVRAGEARAFHAGGVAECGGCHSMHGPAANGSYLLVGTDPSSACLTCHGQAGQNSYHVATPDADLGPGNPPYNLTPGGDFGWLKKTYTVVVRGNTTTEAGETHGHNVIAAGQGYVVDSRNATSPGGSYPGAQLHCSSCHDPHGKYRRAVGDTVATTGLPISTSGSYNNATLNEPTASAAVGVYRLLAGTGYAPVSVPAAGFPGVPPAKVASSYNRSEAASQTRVAYGVVNRAGNTTWGRWCGSCHGAMHSSGSYVHPVDQNIGSRMKSRYDSYVMSGNQRGANATSFSSLAPFATDASASYATLATASSSTAGPGSADQVNCMSCHRAHASGWESMLRWNMGSTFLTYDGSFPGTDTTPTAPELHLGRTSAETQRAYYDRPATVFATYQRVYCNKCHAKD